MQLAKHIGIIVLALPLTLGACSPDGSTRADSGMVIGAVAGGVLGSTVGKGRGRVAATVLGAVIGGIVGTEIGRSMDARDRELASRAEYDAFERGRSGAVTRWHNPDNGRRGEIVPSRPYRRSEKDCRDFTHSIYIDGRRETMRGTACRNRDGTWQNVG